MELIPNVIKWKNHVDEFMRVPLLLVAYSLGGGGPIDKSINCLPKPLPGPTAKADRNERLATLAFVTPWFAQIVHWFVQIVQ